METSTAFNDFWLRRIVEDTGPLQDRDPSFVIKQIPKLALNISVTQHRLNVRELVFYRCRTR